ncbi:MAG: folate-binding protein YgfZ [Proteobacteria bacterium]|nr:folate-binding protein YgfZ [Pseudomonadota bacterium]
MSSAAPDPIPSSPPAHRRLVVAGRDAAAFLQGQLTQDVAAAGAGTALLAALLTAQGRVIATPWLLAEGDTLALVLPSALAEPVRAHLARYVLRAKLTLELADLDAAARARLAAQVGAGPDHPGWPAALIAAGIPEVCAAGRELWVPQMLNLDLLGAISFKKGCYTGQEIVARTQHLGRIKRRMFRYAIGGAGVPLAGEALLAAGQKAGEVVAATAVGGGVECLAVVNLDSRDAPLALGDGRALAPLPLPYRVE